jgi:hypothetical protein
MVPAQDEPAGDWEAESGSLALPKSTRLSLRDGRLAKTLVIERTWSPDREAMLAALRVALALPRVLPDPRERDKP